MRWNKNHMVGVLLKREITLEWSVNLGIASWFWKDAT